VPDSRLTYDGQTLVAERDGVSIRCDLAHGDMPPALGGRIVALHYTLGGKLAEVRESVSRSWRPMTATEAGAAERLLAGLVGGVRGAVAALA
jgi:hypothetical protein